MRELTPWQSEMLLGNAIWLGRAIKDANDKMNVFNLNLALQIDYDDELATDEPYITLWVYNMKNGSWTCAHYDDSHTDIEVYGKIDTIADLWSVL